MPRLPVGQPEMVSRALFRASPNAAQEGVLARKSGDLMSLLAHRGSGRRRSGSGMLQQVANVVGSALGGRSDGGSRGSRSSMGMAAAAISLLCLGAGYALGNVFPWQLRDANQGGLKASATVGRNGVAPGPIGEQEDMRPRSRTFFLTASYPDLGAGAAAARALRSAGLTNARLREYKLKDDSTAYGLVVYYDGDADRDAAQASLLAIPAPDSTFESFRKGTRGWPKQQELR